MSDMRGKAVSRPQVYMMMLLLLLPLLTWGGTAGGNLLAYFSEPPPPGQLQYLLSKLFALSAISLVFAQAMTGMLRRHPNCPEAFRWPRALHRVVGLVAAVCVVLHVALFIAAVSYRTGNTPWALLLPIINQDFYRTSITVGWVAMCALSVAIVAGLLLYSTQPRSMIIRWAHRLALCGLVLIAIHSILIGSESRSLLIALSLTAAAVLVMAHMPSRNRPATDGRGRLSRRINAERAT